MVAKSFRATSGLDAAGEKVINVGKASRTIGSDGVNVDFFTEFNTLQQYDPTRGYAAAIAVIYDRRVWFSRTDIASPAGAFDQLKWTATRNDPKWIYSSVTVPDGTAINSGDYIVADGRFAELLYLMPDNPTEGDLVTIKDGGGNVGVNSISVKSGTKPIRLRDVNSQTYRLTHPYMTVAFIYNAGVWRVAEMQDNRDVNFVSATGSSYYQLHSGMWTMRNSATGKITLQLPRYANDGDIITTYDFDGMSAVNAVTLQIYPGSGQTISYDGVTGAASVSSQRSGYGYFMYDATNKRWTIFDGDTRIRLRRISADLSMLPNDYIFVTPQTNGTVSNVVLTLPSDVDDGDRVYISMYLMGKNQNCTINVKSGTTDKIRTNKNMTQFPQRKDYPGASGWFSVTSLAYNEGTDYLPYIELSYMKATKEWVVADYRPLVERVDATNRSRTGVIALASQEEANKNYEDSPNDETAITPSTLANKISTQTRRGIARLATTAEVNQLSTSTYLDDIIVTPRKLNERTATETRRGLAEVATQTETNTGTDDTTIVTPLKLNTRVATPTLTGIISLVTAGGVPNTNTDRSLSGTEIFNYNDYSQAVTPRTLREYKASETQSGIVWLATQNEVIAGSAAASGYPIVVTPEMLHRKTSTDARIGLIEIATQAETNTGTDYTRAVTPKTLNDRNATESLTGIIALATTAEVAAGTAINKVVVPIRLKEFFNVTSHVSVSGDDGLTQSGTIWDTVSLGILPGTETQRGTLRTGTQNEVNAGALDSVYVTPKKLHAKKATETTEGIIQVATQAETVAGTVANKAVSPKNLKYLVQSESTWRATDARYGFVNLSKGNGTWNGNDTDGSTLPDNGYESVGTAVSPYELNLTLKHYLPLLGKAYDSGMLGGVVPGSWLRRDTAQTVTGAFTFTSNVQVNANVSATGQVVSTGGEIRSVAPSSTATTHIRLMENDGTTERAILFIGNDKPNLLQLRVRNQSIFTFSNTGDLVVPNALTSKSAEIQGDLNVLGGLNMTGIRAITRSGTDLSFGVNSSRMFLASSNAGAVNVNDSGGVYTMLTTKNATTILDPIYVRRDGSTMSGRLDSSDASTFIGQLAWYKLTKPTAASLGNWSINITAAADYNTLPGYAIAVKKTDPVTNVEFVDRYSYTPAPGIFTQHGTDVNNSYQIWAPRPTSGSGASDNAQTLWIRQFNPITNTFDKWGRVYTSNNPPTASELGATSSVGTTMKNLTVTDFIDLGPVRIWPDVNNKSLKFEWIGG